MRLKALFFFIGMFCAVSALGQSHPRRAAHFYNKAEKSWADFQRNAACRRMELAIKKDPASPEAYAQLGQWYYIRHRFEEAERTFTLASARCPNGKKRFAMPRALSLLAIRLPDSALKVIDEFASVKDSAEWSRMRRQALFMRQALVNILPQWPSALGGRINSPYPDMFPSMMVDSQVLYFTRRVKNMDEDLYVAHADTCGEWLDADNMGAPANTPDNESAQFISADGHYLFFSRSDNRSENGWAEGGYDLFMAYRISVDSSWTTPQPFGATINTPAYEGMPSLSPDDNELYFASDRPGGYGGFDIWISRHRDGVWQLPVNAGPNINTPGNETAPFAALDNKTLYFTSDWLPGMGGKDIFVAHRLNDYTWGHTTNLGYPINTACDEESACMTLNGHKMVFASDRAGPAGDYDLYEVNLPRDLQPAPVSYVAGYVYDSITKARLNSAAIYIIDARKGDTIYHFMSNRGDATFLLPLSMNTTYAVHTAHIGYTEVRDTFSFDRQYLTAPFRHDVAMLPYDYVAPINDSLIATIHFNSNQVALPDSDVATIRNALTPFMQDKAVIVYVNAYTDITGTPMINDELSTRRASAVAALINGWGLDNMEVHAKGWGESKMIATNDTEEGQRMNRRVEIILRR